jgi:hypothetical protein
MRIRCTITGLRYTITCLVLAVLCTACTPYLYGVPQESWDRMSEAERVEAMRVYEREQQEARRAAEERAQRRALEREQERARQAALERERLERIEALHDGRGAYGELIRVRLQGGTIRIGDRRHHYQPLTFTLADGETRKIPVSDQNGREVDLSASYGGGALTLEGVRFPYERGWGRGRLYADTGTGGPFALAGVDVFVEVHDRSSRLERNQPRLVIVREAAPVVIREREPERPPVVIVREKEGPRSQPAAEKGAPGAPTAPVPARVQRPNAAAPVLQPPPVQAERAPRSVEVSLLSGEVMVRGQKHAVQRVTLRIAEGERRELAVKAGPEIRSILLYYGNGALFIDAHSERPLGATRLAFEKEWKTGKLYRFDLKGRVPLEKAELKVTGL